MAASVLAGFEETLKAVVGPSVRNRVWDTDDEDPKHTGLPRLVVLDGGAQEQLTSETVTTQGTVLVRAEARGRAAAIALGKQAAACFPEDGPVPFTVDGETITYVKPQGLRVEKAEGRREDGDFRFAAVLTYGVRTERPRTRGS